MGGGTPALRVGLRMAFLGSCRKEQGIGRRRRKMMRIAVWRYRDRGRNSSHMFEYFGPPEPSGGTQVMLRLGSLMSQVLQWTQFCALITKRG